MKYKVFEIEIIFKSVFLKKIYNKIIFFYFLNFIFNISKTNYKLANEFKKLCFDFKLVYKGQD